MKRKLLEVLCCPVCESQFLLRVFEKKGEEVFSGKLTCQKCSNEYSIVDSIPRFLKRENLQSTHKSFTEQWKFRLKDKFEENANFAFKPREQASWIVSKVFKGCKAGDWFLDAGCGTGELAAAVAKMNPDIQVVAMDFNDEISNLSKKFSKIENLHFVHADVLESPFQPNSFNKLISIGVLHHTPDTKIAFQKIERLVASKGKMMLWIYPHPDENEYYKRYYRARDRYFLGKGHKIPAYVRYYLVKLYTIITFPWQMYISWRYFSFPDESLVPKTFDLTEQFRATLFIIYDSISPEYQFRHKQQEVIDWLKGAGFDEIGTDGTGFYWGSERSLPDEIKKAV